MLLKLGFMNFVNRQKEDPSSSRLFPELPARCTGFYSNQFSKWFGRFVTNSLGEEVEARFHSFRHSLRDAYRAAQLPEGIVKTLGGGEGPPKSVMNAYGRGTEGFRVLAQDVAEMEFPGLDLSHLLTPGVAPCRTRLRQ